MARRIDITGDRFGRLLVLRPSHQDKRGEWHWACCCECGTNTTVAGSRLRALRTRSCGCLSRELLVKRQTTHGMGNSPEYTAWQHMRRRCSDPNNADYKNYGARGIQVCERWNTFELFYCDMGPRPSLAHSIDRINNDGNYEPNNCRWATCTQQRRNSRSNHHLTFHGETMCICEWAERLGMNRMTLYHRIRRGWNTERALTEPPGAQGTRNQARLERGKFN